MPAKIFISCGQDSEPERIAAREAGSWLQSQGFDPYVAVTVQSIPDLNKGIIDEIKRSDYYLFINFRRELISQGSGDPIFRGSLYTNQELAIAYALGFQDMIFLNQKFAERRGLFGTIVSNSLEFDRYSEMLPVLQNAISAAKWTPGFSRNLVPVKLEWGQPVNYGDHTFWAGHNKPEKFAKMLLLTVENKRPDRGAISTTMRLKSIQDSNGKFLPIEDTTALKVTSYAGLYNRIIWPNSDGQFDLLCMDLNTPDRFFLNSIRDLSPRNPVIWGVGNYLLTYQAYAEGFPIVDVKVALNVTGQSATATAKLI